jgi:ABC-2 type transport system ATP-binding protein
MEQVLTMVGLWERRKSPVATFSGGMRRRLEIARGLMHSPRVLLLDEPTIGLDPQTRSSIWSYIEQLRRAEDITIFMTTHYMDEAEFCDRIAIMDQGEIVALDTPAALNAPPGLVRGADRLRARDADARHRDLGVQRERVRAPSAVLAALDGRPRELRRQRGGPGGGV